MQGTRFLQCGGCLLHITAYQWCPPPALYSPVRYVRASADTGHPHVWVSSWTWMTKLTIVSHETPATAIWAGAHLPRCQMIPIPWPYPYVNSAHRTWCFFLFFNIEYRSTHHAWHAFYLSTSELMPRTHPTMNKMRNLILGKILKSQREELTSGSQQHRC